MTNEEVVDNIRQYLEDLLAFFEVNLEVSADIRDDVIELNVPSSEANSILIGRNAETLRSLQYILSTKLRGENSNLYRVNLDIADYKKQRAEKPVNYRWNTRECLGCQPHRLYKLTAALSVFDKENS